MRIRVIPAYDVLTGTWYAHEVTPEGALEVGDHPTLASMRAALPKNVQLVGYHPSGWSGELRVTCDVPMQLESLALPAMREMRAALVPSSRKEGSGTYRHKRIHDHDRILDMYQAGKTVAMIAAEVSRTPGSAAISEGTVTSVIKYGRERGDPRASRPRAKHLPRPARDNPWTPQKLEQLQSMRSQVPPRPFADIAQILGPEFTRSACAAKMNRIEGAARAVKAAEERLRRQGVIQGATAT